MIILEKALNNKIVEYKASLEDVEVKYLQEEVKTS